MTTGRADESDAELRYAVIAGWHRLASLVKSRPDELKALVELTGLPFRRLDMVRNVRNQSAHPDTHVSRERVQAALETIAEAEDRIEASKPKRPSRTAGPRRPSRTEGNPDSQRDRKPPSRDISPGLSYRRLSLRRPSTAPKAASGGRPQQPEPHRVEVHVTPGGEPVHRAVHMSELGIRWRSGRVISDAPWLHGGIVGNSVRLTVDPPEGNDPRSGTLRIRSRQGQVTIIVDVRFLPTSSRTTPPVRPEPEPVIEFVRARHKKLPHQEDALMAVAVVLFVAAVFVLMVAVL